MPLHFYVLQDLFPEWLCKETIYLFRVGDIPLILHWQTQLCFHVISKKHHSLKSSSYKSFYIISMIFYDFALHFVYSGKDEIFFPLYCVVGITYLIKIRLAFTFAYALKKLSQTLWICVYGSGEIRFVDLRLWKLNSVCSANHWGNEITIILTPNKPIL